MPAAADAALGYAQRFGWPVLPIRAHAKTPLTRNGVRDASTNPDQIRAWWNQWPDANVAVATGAPGPQVLDIDNLADARPTLQRLPRGAPQAATHRGFHIYFRGVDTGTVTLGYGELRGTGSYVVCPPSLHPAGPEYTWLDSPAGPLPPLPDFLTTGRGTAGRGQQPPVELVPHGQRHGHLLDVAVRLLRAGITDQQRIVVHLRAEFEHYCAPTPPPAAGYFEQLAGWATRSHIAERERSLATFAGRWSAPPGEATA